MTNKSKISYQLIAGCGARVGEWFYSYVLRSSLQHSSIEGERIDSQFPFLSIINYPFKHTTNEGFKEQDREPLLDEVVQALGMSAQRECVFLCNTFYCLKDELQKRIEKKKIDTNILWLESVLIRNLKHSQKKAKTLILCSSKSAHEKLYSQIFTNCVYPDESAQKRLDGVIGRVCLYQDGEEDVGVVTGVVREFLQENDCDTQVLIGCSELSIIAELVQQDSSIKRGAAAQVQFSNDFLCPLRMLSLDILRHRR